MDRFREHKDYWAVLVPELHVRDLAASLSFYCDVIGFQIKFDRPEAGFAYLELGQAQIMLDQIPEDELDAWITAPLEAPLGRGINFQIEVQDLRSLHKRLEKADNPLFKSIEEAWYRENDVENGQIQLLVQDPDGYLLRFTEYLGTRPAKRPQPNKS